MENDKNMEISLTGKDENLGEEDIPLLVSNDSAVPLDSTTPEKVSFKRITANMLKQVIPYSATGLLINAGSFVNVLILSKLGDEVLASTALISVTQLLTTATAKASLSSTSVVAARKLENPDTLGVVLQQSWVQSSIESIFFASFLGLSEQFFLLTGQKPNLSKIAGDYLKVYIIALPALLGLKSNEMFAIGTNHPKLVLVFNGLHNITTLGLTYVLALGKFGFPKLGINGGAYATALSSWFYFSTMTLYFRFHKDFRQFRIFSLTQKERCNTLKTLFAVGIPLGLQVCIEYAFIYAKTLMAGNLGQEALSAEQIVTQWASLFLGINGSIATINGVMSSSDITKNQALNLRNIGFSGLMLSSTVSLVALILFATAYRPLSSPFINTSTDTYEKVMGLVKGLFLVNGINEIVDAISKTSTGSLRGFYDTAIPMLYSLVGLWLVGIPTSYLLGFTAGIGVSGFAMGRVIGLSTASVPQFFRWYKKSGDAEQVVEESEFSTWPHFFQQSKCLPCKKKQTDEESESRSNNFSVKSLCNIL